MVVDISGHQGVEFRRETSQHHEAGNDAVEQRILRKNNASEFHCHLNDLNKNKVVVNFIDKSRPCTEVISGDDSSSVAAADDAVDMRRCRASSEGICNGC